jgi:alternate signal-mediated exported protein
MTITPRTEAERKSRRVKGIAAGVAGIAMLLGGSTFALWSDSESLGGATEIIHGKLDLGGTVTKKIYDISATQNAAHTGTSLLATGTARDITSDIANVRAVPGDDYEIDMTGITVDLAGDNMVANLVFKLDSGTVYSDGWTFAYTLFKDGSTVSGKTNVTATATEMQTGITISDLNVSSSSYSLAIKASFDATGTNYIFTDGTANTNGELLKLPDFSATLTQVRPSS